MNLRCTISGGLEDLAAKELQDAFPTSRIVWTQRGNSGSQLGLETPTSTQLQLDEIVQVMQTLRFVEYMYYVVHSQEYDTPTKINNSYDDQNLLSEIRSNIALDSIQLQFATTFGRSLQQVLRNRSVGLETLPGELLPFPPVIIKDTGLPTDRSMTSAFHVNTIYTKSGVAKAVVDLFIEKVRQHFLSSSSFCFDNNSIVWLDAGAGTGALLQHLPQNFRLGVDLSPCTNPEIHQANFLEISPDFIKQHLPSAIQSILCVVSNPPFTEGSRGDYSAILQFLNHSTRVLKASFVGLIVPAKFARERIWASLGGIDPHVRLLSRCLLPEDSFMDPATYKSVHIHSYFLIFGVESTKKDLFTESLLPISQPPPRIPDSFYLHGKRDKGDFPSLTTKELVQSVAIALSSYPPGPLLLASEREAEFPLLVKLQKANTNNRTRLELWLLLNPERPLSLSNSVACRIRQHSLGWMSLSVKPPVAHAMLQLQSTSDTTLLVNTMIGEGTIELEAQHFISKGASCFLISGDKSETIALKTAERLRELEGVIQTRCPVDLVVWDAQRLPIRRDIVDLFLADLPFAGSQNQKHQVPDCQKDHNVSSLNYRSVMTQAVRVLKPHGVAAVISADTKALAYSTGNLHWRSVPHKGINRINLGGLNAQLLVLTKGVPCNKDLSVWVEESTLDLSQELQRQIVESVKGWYLDDLLELKRDGLLRRPSLVMTVQLLDEYYHQQSQRLSHCYRITVDSRLTNIQAKQLEQLTRAAIESSPLNGITGIR